MRRRCPKKPVRIVATKELDPRELWGFVVHPEDRAVRDVAAAEQKPSMPSEHSKGNGVPDAA